MSTARAFPALDHAGLRYAVRSLPDGTPYAGLSWSSRDARRPLGLTVVPEPDGLRLTAHGVVRDEDGGLARLHLTTTRLPRGRLLRVPHEDASDLAMTLWGDRRRETDALWSALTYLEDVRDWLDGRREAPEAPVDPVPVEEREVDGLVVRLGRTGDGVLVGRADVPVPPLVIDAPTAAWVDRLQWWAPGGRYLLGPANTLVAEVRSDPLVDDGDRQGLRTRVAQAVRALVAEAARTVR